MKWIARLGEREETVEIDASADLVRVRVGDQTLDLDVGAGLTGRRGPGSTAGAEAASNREGSVIHAGRQHEVAIERLSKSRYAVSIDGRLHEVTVDDQLGFLNREAAEARTGVGGTVTAYMPGRVAAVLVEEGAEVEAGEGVVVLEAMKMENEIQSDIDGVVAKIHVEAGQAVEGGDALFEVVDSG